MNIYIVESKIRFKAPQPGQQTRACVEHYNGRRVIAEIDGQERVFFFKNSEMPFEATEEDIVQAIIQRMAHE